MYDRTMAMQTTSQREAALLFAHRANVERYERLLRTHLTDLERAFIQRRLAEEQDAVLQSCGEGPANSRSISRISNL
jgi:hypothetical protein